VHFAKDSIHEKTLGECIRSACFRDARSRQPFGDDRDLRRPCPQIDRPEILKELVEKHGMKGTHPDAEDILGGQYGLLCREARAYADVLERHDAACACAKRPEPAAAAGTPA